MTLTHDVRIRGKASPLMAHTTFEQSILIAAPHEAVRDELAHLMTNVSELHPFVVWTRLIKTETAPDGSKIEYYQVRDRMKLGPFTIAFTYKVDMNVTPGGQLISNAYQSPGIHLYNQTSFTETDNGTLVSEHIDITAPGWLLKTTYEGAAVSHKEMFAKLKEKIEQTRTSGPAEHQGEVKQPGGETPVS